MSTFEYATVEWIWNGNAIRVNLPGGDEATSEGSYAEVVSTLTKLGGEGWEVVSCVASANWLFWTLKRSTSNV